MRHAEAGVLGLIGVGVAGEVVVGEGVGAADPAVDGALDDLVDLREVVGVPGLGHGLGPQVDQVVLVTGVAEPGRGVELGLEGGVERVGDRVVLQDADHRRPDDPVGRAARQLQVLRDRRRVLLVDQRLGRRLGELLDERRLVAGRVVAEEHDPRGLAADLDQRGAPVRLRHGELLEHRALPAELLHRGLEGLGDVQAVGVVAGDDRPSSSTSGVHAFLAMRSWTSVDETGAVPGLRRVALEDVLEPVLLHEVDVAVPGVDVEHRDAGLADDRVLHRGVGGERHEYRGHVLRDELLEDVLHHVRLLGLRVQRRPASAAGRARRPRR